MNSHGCQAHCCGETSTKSHQPPSLVTFKYSEAGFDVAEGNTNSAPAHKSQKAAL
jgi:hypothetical protein